MNSANSNDACVSKPLAKSCIASSAIGDNLTPGASTNLAAASSLMVLSTFSLAAEPKSTERPLN